MAPKRSIAKVSEPPSKYRRSEVPTAPSDKCWSCHEGGFGRYCGKADDRKRRCCKSCYTARSCSTCKTFHDDKNAAWCSECEERIAVWCSACEGQSNVSKSLCKGCLLRGGQKRNVPVPAEYGSHWKRAVKASDFCRNEHQPLKRVYRGGFCFKCFQAQEGVEAKTITCYLCGPPKPARIQCPNSGHRFCKSCAHDMCPEALLKAADSEEATSRRRCFACFSTDAIAEFACEATAECRATVWLCGECKVEARPVPCPDCWIKVVSRSCLRCHDALDLSGQLLQRLCVACGSTTRRRCFACSVPVPADAVQQCAVGASCNGKVLLCEVCVQLGFDVSCVTCWSARWKGKCYRCKTAEIRRGAKWGRLCKSCFNDSPESATATTCYYCFMTCGNVHRRQCTWKGDECMRAVAVCDTCAHLNEGKVVCSRCWSKDWELGCFKCKDKWSQQTTRHGRFCMKCFGLHIPEGQKATLMDEGDAYIASQKQQHIVITGNEPALQLLLLPLNTEPLPQYGATAHFRSPVHCRLCLQFSVPPSALHNTHWALGAHSDGTGEYTLHPLLAQHVLKEHGMTPQQYRQNILRRTLAEWPKGSQVQTEVLRTRLYAYKHSLCDELYREGHCACCARKKKCHKLIDAVFPRNECLAVPKWLGWTQEYWEEQRKEWSEAVGQLLDTKIYLDKYFELSQRKRLARESLHGAEQAAAVHGARSEPAGGNTPANGLSCGMERRCRAAVEDARVWLERVEAWARHLEDDISADSIQSPFDPDKRLLLYFPNAEVTTSSDGVVCKLCRKCTEGFRACTAQGVPKPRLAVEARANGLWQGPEPAALKCLSYVEGRILCLARVGVTLKRVLKMHALWAKDDESALPQYSTSNVVAYPQDPDAAVRVLCLLPENLCQVLTVQFVGEDASVVSKEPAFEVSIARLRAALYWFVTHNWYWLLATKEYGKLERDRMSFFSCHHLDGCL